MEYLGGCELLQSPVIKLLIVLLILYYVMPPSDAYTDGGRVYDQQYLSYPSQHSTYSGVSGYGRNY